MEFHVITLFPEMFAALDAGLIGRAQKQGLIAIRAHNLRDHGLGNYRQVDDTPYGGGSGMVMRIEPLASAVDSVIAERSPLIERVRVRPTARPTPPLSARSRPTARKRAMLE